MSEKYYVSGCVDNGLSAEVVEDEHAEFWTLYARDSEGLSEGIIDFVFREDAEAAMAVYVERDALSTEIGALNSIIASRDFDIQQLNEQVRALAAENAALKSGVGFFSYDSDSGFDEHATANEAMEAADASIDYYRGDACDGWGEEVDRVCWGVVMQSSTKVGERPRHEEYSCDPAIDTVCDYALLPSIETPATDAIQNEVRARELDAIAGELAALDTVGSTGAIAYVIRQKAAAIRAGEVPDV